MYVHVYTASAPLKLQLNDIAEGREGREGGSGRGGDRRKRERVLERGRGGEGEVKYSVINTLYLIIID